LLPRSIQVLQRGWLSCNNVLLAGPEGVTLVDSGYGDHAPQTLALVDHALAGRRLTWLVNTHCHSDHMGGNHAVQERYGCRTTIPAGEAPLIDAWDEDALVLGFADQRAERFRYDDTLAIGDAFRMGELDWQAIGAPGHDPHALMFHAPAERVLIAGDALWEDGFGIIFPALFGDTHALVETRRTLDEIAQLDPRTVIPGHGPVFDRVVPALERAYSRLEGYERDLTRLARHAAKVMVVFALLQKRRMALAALPAYCESVGMLRHLNREFLGLAPEAMAQWLVEDLERARAVAREDGHLVPRIRA
jgi:glyoxylase-like metal-dependent hydrolase (beta-lactamase superfamily II)